MAEYILPIQRLIDEFRKLPGVGGKTAVRYAFSVLNMSEEEAIRFSETIVGAKRDVKKCSVCFALSEGEVCDICANERRDHSTVCVVENPKDVIVMEKVRGFRGVYHVLGGALAPLDNITPQDLTIKELVERVRTGEIKELIIATNPTPSGDTTASYLARILEEYDIEISRLAYGIPVGGDIEYADEVTLYRAMEGRRTLK